MRSSFEEFKSTQKRSIGLFNLYEYCEKSSGKVTDLELTDIVRSGIVLAVSAMDAYFTSKFTHMIVSYIKKKKKTSGIADVLTKAGLNASVTLDLLEMDRPYRRIHTLVSTYLENYVTQKFEIVDSLFQNYGIIKLCENAQKKAKRKELLRRIELLIERRHEIAHGGDINDHGNLIPLDVNRFKGYVVDTKLFIEKCEEIINSAAG